MKTSYFIGGVVVAALSVTAVGASAKEGDRHHRGGEPMTFEQLDTNGDGFITVEEMEAHAKSRFMQLDTDGDGAISLEEMKSKFSAKEGSEGNSDRRAKKLDKMFSKMDTNGDGKLTEDEMKPRGDRHAKMFERMDADGDGKISQAEFDAHKAERQAKMADRKAKMFEKLDTNGDGVISKEEFEAGKFGKKRAGKAQGN
ncbi:Ca2+-binding EF-hand superfamily protein [Shimia isoporae]|uniref:Ca2+-binding EF-hand superfamily protein n=1 Tax=Shimia isoporae TaxID=647720 RepID=A0A4V2Q484_9RHOB|nr:EF-hand domain-containing protein [Shimia isoporae]TCL10170.1 Ca2+-binding EF-hand superfamily protein [Shimia isoporae]